MLSGAACCSLARWLQGHTADLWSVSTMGPCPGCLAWRAHPCLACSSFTLVLAPSCPWLSSPFLPIHGVAGMVLAVILVSFCPAWLL